MFWSWFLFAIFEKENNKTSCVEKMSAVNIKDSPAIKDYSVLEVIGTGSFSVVYRARQKQVVFKS